LGWSSGNRTAGAVCGGAREFRGAFPLPGFLLNPPGHSDRLRSAKRRPVMKSSSVILPLLLGFALITVALQGQTLSRVSTLDGFQTPESVVVDPESGMAYVSNMATSPESYWEDTGKGFISRLKPDGTIDRLRWVESTDAFVIHQPKGMAIQDGNLYVADNTRVLVFSIADGRPLSARKIAGAQQLNDMATDGKHVYVSDTGTGKILRLEPDSQDAPAVVGVIEGVNGITFRQGQLFAVSWTLHEIFELSLTGEHEPKPFGLDRHFTNLDGIEPMPDGTFIVSDFTGNRVALVSADRKQVRTLSELTTPADIGIDRKGMRLYVPQLQADRVVVFSLSTQHP
jgi:DNA-binding beta-propeller fold protein YncE